MDGRMSGKDGGTGNSYRYVPPRSGGPRSAAARRKWLCNGVWPVHGGDVESRPRHMYSTCMCSLVRNCIAGMMGVERLPVYGSRAAPGRGISTGT